MTSWRRQVHVGGQSRRSNTCSFEYRYMYRYLNTRVPEMYMTLIRTLKPKSILYLPVPPSRSAYHSPSLLDSKPYHTSYKPNKMPSSKGEPTDPELREKVKEEVKAEEKGKVPYPSIHLSIYPSIYLPDLSIRLSINQQTLLST